MSFWLKLTWQFGLPDAGRTEHATLDAIGHILRAESSDIAKAAIPLRIKNLLNELRRHDRRALAPVRVPRSDRPVYRQSADRPTGVP
jgi:hypothetical protein